MQSKKFRNGFIFSKCHELWGQAPIEQALVGDGPLGQDSQARAAELLCPTAKPLNSFCKSELPHFWHLCFRGFLVFSKNSIVCPHLLHLYSNIGTTKSPYKIFSIVYILSIKLIKCNSYHERDVSAWVNIPKNKQKENSCSHKENLYD